MTAGPAPGLIPAARPRGYRGFMVSSRGATGTAAAAQAAEAVSAPWFVRVLPRPGTRSVPDAIDYAVAAACFAAGPLPVLAGLAPGAGPLPAVAALGLLATAPLIVRRRWPRAVVVLVAAACVAASLAGVQFTPFVSSAGPALAVAVFTAADRCDRRSSLTAAIGVAVATWIVLGPAIHLHHGVDQDAVQALVAVPAWVAGDMVRVRRGYQQRLAAEVRRRSADAAARDRAEERLRLSREVHDVVSHSLATIAVRSGVARLLIDEQPAEARAALAAIETASRSALDELRVLLRQIREQPAAAEAALPTLADLPALIDQLRRGGLNVTCQRRGEPRGYPAALELSAYRITQEALTNVAKHAPAARACVEIMHGPGELAISVTDDGGQAGELRAAPGGPGLGITGMRERAALLGGQLTAQPRPGGGFAVSARLPAPASAA
jgi:signal transduction histidine kinase